MLRVQGARHDERRGVIYSLTIADLLEHLPDDILCIVEAIIRLSCQERKRHASCWVDMKVMFEDAVPILD